MGRAVIQSQRLGVRVPEWLRECRGRCSIRVMTKVPSIAGSTPVTRINTHATLAQLDRSTGLRCRRPKVRILHVAPHHEHRQAALAQRIRAQAWDHEVAGSNPARRSPSSAAQWHATMAPGLLEFNLEVYPAQSRIFGGLLN